MDERRGERALRDEHLALRAVLAVEEQRVEDLVRELREAAAEVRVDGCRIAHERSGHHRRRRRATPELERRVEECQAARPEPAERGTRPAIEPLEALDAARGAEEPFGQHASRDGSGATVEHEAEQLDVRARASAAEKQLLAGARRYDRLGTASHALAVPAGARRRDT